MTTSNISGKHEHNTDVISARITIAVLAICGLLSMWVVLHKFMAG
jgi:hypothetical protein